MKEKLWWEIYRWRLRVHSRKSTQAHMCPVQEAIDKGLLEKDWQAWLKVGKAWRKWREAGGLWEGE